MRFMNKFIMIKQKNLRVYKREKSKKKNKGERERERGKGEEESFNSQ